MYVGSPSVPVNLIISQNNTAIANNSITVRLDWSPPLDGNISYQVTVDNATEVMYTDDTMAFVRLNLSGQYRVNITDLNFPGAAASLTWNVNSERSSCIVSYGAINTMTDGDCNATTTTLSVDSNDTNLFIFNSKLSINLTERLTVSCANISRGVVQTTLDLTGTVKF